jgi:7-cyano-7-deazaguanine reductase
MNSPHDSSLGKPVEYRDERDPSLLFQIARADNRAAIGIGDELPFIGVDVWNAYELSWLDTRGKPKVALAEFRVPANSPNLIESKSFKLYLNSYMQTRLADTEALRNHLAHDLSAAAGAPVSAVLTPASSAHAAPVEQLLGELIDDMSIEIDNYGPPDANLLDCDPQRIVDETLVSHLLKSNCPVTGQPDWASLQVAYRGARIDRDGLLRYLISYRQHSDFHEACVERIFMDLMRECAPSKLAVYARYTRRGGLDINPFRATPGRPLPGNPRSARQ